MAKSGSKEWYKAKYDAAHKAELSALAGQDRAVAKINELKAELEALKAELKEGGLRVDTSLLSERRLAGLKKFLAKTQRFTKREPGQVAAACLANVADGSRRIPVAGLMSQLKRMNGLGLRR